MKTAHLQPLEFPAYLARIGPAGFRLGDPYEVCLTVLDLGQGVCEIRGLCQRLLPSHWRAMRQALGAAGFRKCRFQRCKSGEMTEREIT